MKAHYNRPIIIGTINITVTYGDTLQKPEPKKPSIVFTFLVKHWKHIILLLGMLLS